MPPADGAEAIEQLLADIPGLPDKFCIALGQAEGDLMILDGEIHADGRTTPFTLETLRALVLQGRRPRTPQPRPTIPGLLLALPFGQTAAAALTRLAYLTDEARTTPWRALHIPTPPDPAPFAAAGFITNQTDPRLSIAACPGAPACAAGQAPARADAARLAALNLGPLHISGCTKGCAHPGPARTLVGRAGRYDLVPHGRAADTPSITGLTLEQMIPYL